MIQVYTCILNHYDNLRPPAFREPVTKHVCYSDVMHSADGWEIQPAYQPYSCVRRNSRIPKILAHLHADTEYSVWHDGCFRVAVSMQGLVNEWLRDADIALFRHPRRPDIFTETDYCEQAGIGDIVAIREQVARFRADGFPGPPFFAGGIIFRLHTPEVAQFNELWWSEYLKGPARDQFALAYAVWKSGVRFRVIERCDILQNPWLSFQHHAMFPHLSDNPQYEAQRQRSIDRIERLKTLCAS